MTREERCKWKKEAAMAFLGTGEIESIEPYGSGHINDTFLVIQREKNNKKRFILQRMNQDIFQNPSNLMENIVNVTTYLTKEIKKRGGDPERETLTVILTQDKKSYYKDAYGECWRMYIFIESATSYDVVKKPDDFYQSALAFGHFQHLLAEFPAEILHETIPNFHNTKDRLALFKQAIKEDRAGRASMVQPEIQFVLKREKDACALTDMLEHGELPLRVTHNDTKLNNIMIDDNTGQGICVIDLDTVMPGLSVYDFGDSIRFGANTGAEDEVDLNKVSLDLSLFELYLKGYLKGCEKSLTKKEIAMMPMGAKVMTLECGIRFLTDYLNGDTYFKIHRENQNLDRCRSQFKLVEDMESKWDKMEDIVEKNN